MDIPKLKHTGNFWDNIQRNFRRGIQALYFIHCIYHKFTNRLLESSKQILELFALKLGHLLDLIETQKGQG